MELRDSKLTNSVIIFPTRLCSAFPDCIEMMMGVEKCTGFSTVLGPLDCPGMKKRKGKKKKGFEDTAVDNALGMTSLPT